MASNPDHLPRWALPLATLASALAWWFGSGLHPLWWAAWLAPLPLLLCAARSRARWMALATCVAFATGGAHMWRYLHDVIGLPLPVCLSAILLPALLMVPPALLWRAWARRGHALAALLAFPLATTGLAWLGAATSPHGTFGLLAYSQSDALPVLQIAALTGPWGVGFLVWLLPSLLALAAAPGLRAGKRAGAMLAGGVLLVAALGYGTWRLHADAPAAHIRIGLVSIGDSKQAQADLGAAEGRRLLAAYLAEMERLSMRGAQVVVAPESALLVRAQAIAPLQALATRRNVRILIGAEDHSDPQRKHNAALLFTPARMQPQAYFKRHLIPGFEDRYTPGTTDAVLPGNPRIGMAICKDLDFTTTGLAHGRMGTQLLLVPAWDFGDDARLHGRMAILRGVENGFAIARVARDGNLTLSDSRGRVLAQASAVGRTTATTLLGDLPLHDTPTPYSRIGDVFGPLSLCLAGMLGIALLVRRRT